jgi:hypothetical protein
VDELSSFTGLAREHCTNVPELAALVAELEVVQCRLQELGSHVATPRVDLESAKDPRAAKARMEKTKFRDSYTEVGPQNADSTCNAIWFDHLLGGPAFRYWGFFFPCTQKSGCGSIGAGRMETLAAQRLMRLHDRTTARLPHMAAAKHCCAQLRFCNSAIR